MTEIENINILKAYDKMNWYAEQMRSNNGMLWYPSQYPALDKFTSWIIPWKVYTIAAYSNVGKSRFSYGYVNHFLKQWKKVLFVSLEVDKWLLLQHLCCNMYDVYNHELHDGMIDLEDFKNLYIFDDLYEMWGIEQIILDFKPDVCFIDFVQNISVKNMMWYEGMAFVARKIQELAITTNTTMFCLSQLSNTVARDVSTGKTDFIALKWAWEFVASSDVVLLLRMVDWQMGITVVKTKFASKPDWEIYLIPNFWKSTFTMNNDPFTNKEIF